MTHVAHILFLLTTQAMIIGALCNTKALRKCRVMKCDSKKIICSEKAKEASGNKSRRLVGIGEGIINIFTTASNIKA